MTNYFDILFSPVNITLSVLLSLLLVYWIITLVVGLDFDMDIDVDIDVDADIDGSSMDFTDTSNAEVDRKHVINKGTYNLKWWQVVLIYFNFVGLPFMFTFTAWIFCWWFISVIATTITSSYNNVFGFIIVLVAFVPSLFINKAFTAPFKSFFKRINRDGDEPVDYLGREAVLLSTISGDKMGNAEVTANGDTLNIYVKSINGEELRFRESVLIIQEAADKSHYLVTKNDSTTI